MSRHCLSPVCVPFCLLAYLVCLLSVCMIYRLDLPVSTFLPDHRTRREIITVRGQSYFSRLPKYWTTTPYPPGECVLPPDGEGGGGSMFWKTRGIGLPSYSKNLSTTALYRKFETFPEMKLRGLLQNFYSHVLRERFIYSDDLSYLEFPKFPIWKLWIINGNN